MGALMKGSLNLSLVEFLKIVGFYNLWCDVSLVVSQLRVVTANKHRF
jgi:hypothetical protein